MSRLHIQAGDGGNRFNVICHAPTPVGNNAAGVSWATAIKNSSAPVTSMTIGNGPGQISTAESNDVANGAVIEVSFPLDDDPTWDAAARTANINAVAIDAMIRTVVLMQARLKYFGKDIA